MRHRDLYTFLKGLQLIRGSSVTEQRGYILSCSINTTKKHDNSLKILNKSWPGRNESPWEPFWNCWEVFMDNFSDFFICLFLAYLIAMQNPQSESYLFCNHRYQSILPSKFGAGKKCLLPRIPAPHLGLFQRCLPHYWEASTHSLRHTPTT